MTSGEKTGEPVRAHVIYSGHVQGVCFRITTCELSRGYEVGGYVRNLPDGTVELEAQGAPKEVERFLSAVGAKFEGNIASMKRDAMTPRPETGGFRIT